MGVFSNTVFSILIGWLRTVAQSVWNAFTGKGGGGLLVWIGNNWIPIALFLCITGAGLDLIVYILRWKPIQVWKSYFRRRKNRKLSDPEDTGMPMYAPDEQWEEDVRIPFFAADRPVSEPAPEEVFRPAWQSGRWTQEQPAEDDDYRSVYRRPVSYTEAPVPEGNAGYDGYDGYDGYGAYEAAPDAKSMTQRNVEKVIGPRRRRMRVSQLFNNPDEAEEGRFEAPQPVIDRYEAYHAPVYPRNWKDDGDDQP